jgi:nitroreductase
MADEIGLFEAMYSQKALRRLKADPVSDDLVKKLVDAAIRAPSGGNTQPWSFIVIKDPSTKQKIAEWYLDAWNQTYARIPKEQLEQADEVFQRTYRSANHLAHNIAQAPVWIIACVATLPGRGGLQGAASASNYGSIFPAVQNLLLAARGLGLGASLTTLHKFHEDDVKALLGIPENLETVSLIPIGWPKGKYGPAARRPVEEVMHFEKWEGKE